MYAVATRWFLTSTRLSPFSVSAAPEKLYDPKYTRADGLSASMTTNLWCMRVPTAPAVGSCENGFGASLPSASGNTGATLPFGVCTSRPPTALSEMPNTNRSGLSVTCLIASRTGPGVSYKNASEYSSDDFVPAMSAAMDCSSTFDAECGENATCPRTSGNPRSVHFAESVVPKSCGSSDQ